MNGIYQILCDCYLQPATILLYHIIILQKIWKNEPHFQLKRQYSTQLVINIGAKKYSNTEMQDVSQNYENCTNTIEVLWIYLFPNFSPESSLWYTSVFQYTFSGRFVIQNRDYFRIFLCRLLCDKSLKTNVLVVLNVSVNKCPGKVKHI